MGDGIEKVVEQGQSTPNRWSTRLAFVLAASGSAVGLGNVWKFPYITGSHGGSAFILLYLLCLAAVAIPVLMAEVMIGREGRMSPVGTFDRLCSQHGIYRRWQICGWLVMIAGFVILSFYSVVAGWAMAYVVRTAMGQFTWVTADGAAAIFADLVEDPERLLAWHTLFMGLTILIVSRGVRGGLERAAAWLMPALVVLLLVLVVYGTRLHGFRAAVDYLLRPDFGALDHGAFLAALGHAFFTLSLGVGAMMTYGAYLGRNSSIGGSCLLVATLDTVVALLAGLAIFPLVFSNGLEPGLGVGLAFQTLPIAFGQLPNGVFLGTLFFGLLTLAALTSAISLAEPAVAWLQERRRMSRVKAATSVGIAAWALGLGSVVSFTEHSRIDLLAGSIYEFLDYAASNVMLPLGGLLVILFAGWVLPRSVVLDQLGGNHRRWPAIWLRLARYVTPGLMLLVFLESLGLLA